MKNCPPKSLKYEQNVKSLIYSRDFTKTKENLLAHKMPKISIKAGMFSKTFFVLSSYRIDSTNLGPLSVY